MTFQPGFPYSAFAARAIREGLSANAFQRRLIDAGIGFRRASVQQLYGQVRSDLGRRDLIQSISPEIPIGDQHAHRFPGREGGQRYYHFRFYYRTPGSDQVISEPIGFNSPDVLSVDEAEGQMAGIMDTPDAEDRYQRKFLGVSLVQVYSPTGQYGRV